MNGLEPNLKGEQSEAQNYKLNESVDILVISSSDKL